MYTEEDRRRLLESRHDLGALADPGALTDNTIMAAAAVASGAELAANREAVRVAAADIEREHGETDSEPAASHTLSRETDKHADAMKALSAAREAFDRSALAHAHLMESILVRQKREAELGRYVLVREAAYAARRAAHAPVSGEPALEK
jgi:hypothetical protein